MEMAAAWAALLDVPCDESTNLETQWILVLFERDISRIHERTSAVHKPTKAL